MIVAVLARFWSTLKSQIACIFWKRKAIRKSRKLEPVSRRCLSLLEELGSTTNAGRRHMIMVELDCEMAVLRATKFSAGASLGFTHHPTRANLLNNLKRSYYTNR